MGGISSYVTSDPPPRFGRAANVRKARLVNVPGPTPTAGAHGRAETTSGEGDRCGADRRDARASDRDGDGARSRVDPPDPPVAVVGQRLAAGLGVARLHAVLLRMAAAVATAVLQARVECALALGFELQVIAACLIGGVAIAGGVGTVAGVVLGCLFIGVIRNALNLLNVGIFFQMIAIGLIIVLAVGTSMPVSMIVVHRSTLKRC